MQRWVPELGDISIKAPAAGFLQGSTRTGAVPLLELFAHVGRPFNRWLYTRPATHVQLRLLVVPVALTCNEPVRTYVW